jgi:F-type H+-transporting ATPase subunit epsilon
MAESFEIEIATPERLLASEKAVRAQIPAKDGFIGVLPDHAALLSELGIGALTYSTPGGQFYSLAISGGFLEIRDNIVRILSDSAERAQEIDVPKAEQALKDAQDALSKPAQDMDFAPALAAAMHAQARIDAARKAADKED